MEEMRAAQLIAYMLHHNVCPSYVFKDAKRLCNLPMINVKLNCDPEYPKRCTECWMKELKRLKVRLIKEEE